MRIAVDVNIDPWALAKTLDHDEAHDFIMAIDGTIADYDFTLELMKRLSSGMEKEADEYAHVFKQITELLSSIK